MLQQPILFCEIFDACGIDFMGLFPPSYGYTYILLAVDGGLEYRSYWVVKSYNNDHEEAGLNRLLQIQELEKIRLDAYHSSDIYKQKTKIIHDAKILRKRFKEGDEVLRYQARFKFKKGKFKMSWDGPYIITKVHNFMMIEMKEEATGKIFQYNGHLFKARSPL
ncbi:uncharacterized protein LOC114754089 [Neltuma alba]|uniref:uncharacterized protein LOC114754089 n=1 Tax=Neltuma alba TaxID=207710 RepID=UPI0010A37D3F|nr:uncharacterized protein LOC114754089 [Prosopis alba]